jgi:acid-sensing ion channel, other
VLLTCNATGIADWSDTVEALLIGKVSFLFSDCKNMEGSKIAPFHPDYPKSGKEMVLFSGPPAEKHVKSTRQLCMEVSRDLVYDYSSNSTIHGINYMGERDRSWFERIWWMIVFIISVICCAILIGDTYTKWQKNPVIVSFAEKSTPIWQIPFPAVTICPETKSKAKFMNITDVYNQFLADKNLLYKLSESERVRLTAISQVCDPEIFENIDPKGRTSCKDCIDTLRDIGVEKTDVLVECQYRKNFEKCDDLFEELVTEEGICYTFNSLKNYRLFSFYDDMIVDQRPSDWNLEDGYKASASLDTIPRRALGSGTRFGLFVMLALQKFDYDYVCKGPVQGFKLLLHMPTEVPQVTKHFYRIPMEQEVIVVIKPKMMITSPELNDYPVYKRQCYFSHERQLRYFKDYTQNNCEIECLANFTMRKCGCMRFYMPRLPGAEVCGTSKNSCYQKSEFELLQLQINQGLKDHESDEFQMDCDCLPGCNSITYDAEISQSDFNMTAYMEARRTTIANMDE